MRGDKPPLALSRCADGALPVAPENRVPRREIGHVRTLDKRADYVLDRDPTTCELTKVAIDLTKVGTRCDRDHAAGDRDGLDLGIPRRLLGVAAKVPLHVSRHRLVLSGDRRGARPARVVPIEHCPHAGREGNRGCHPQDEPLPRHAPGHWPGNYAMAPDLAACKSRAIRARQPLVGVTLPA